MYSVDIQNGGVIKKIKGIKSSVVKNTITFDDYLQCLRENTIISREQHNIRSRLHVLRSEKERKIALSPHDDKRYLVPGDRRHSAVGSQKTSRASLQPRSQPATSHPIRARPPVSEDSSKRADAGLCNSSTRSFF
ncbi:unnamed protein product [Trichogramma brassicae]|uniref:Uncharacterized protein n=1 Tax=Trichogramma brassicae TaxID=86971 RepID=A0A6H5HT36_9HYME|nr:unnamed protein product [Trichogramma brassicae]